MPQSLQKHLPPYFVPLTRKIGGLRATSSPPTTPEVLRICHSRGLFPAFQAPCSSLLSVFFSNLVFCLSSPGCCPPGLSHPYPNPMANSKSRWYICFTCINRLSLWLTQLSIAFACFTVTRGSPKDNKGWAAVPEIRLVSLYSISGSQT